MPKIPKKTIYPRGIIREYSPQHTYSDGAGGIWTHDGYGAVCLKPECVAWRKEQTDPDPRPDPLAPCPATGHEHRWTWADDGNGHSGDVCACGASKE